MIWPFSSKANAPADEPHKRPVKTYSEVVQELWAEANASPTLAALSLRTMPLAEGPIQIHCLLTMYLIREVERLKDDNRTRQPEGPA